MATVVEEANAYFPSISNLAARVFADVELVKQACLASGEWDELTVEEQELITDQVLIDSQVLEKYSSTTKNDEYPDCFPVLKLRSGEKIVVDFERDDSWTWTDEHSAPFSWKTKSQQDLTLDDLDDSHCSKDDPNKRSRFIKRLRSPDRSVWDTSFFPGSGSKNEIEKMFERFKIKMAADDEDTVCSDNPKINLGSAVTDGVADFSPAHSEHSKLISGVNKAYTYSADDDTHTVCVKDLKQDGEKTGKKKHRHKKDKRDKEKKSRHGKSKSKCAAEPDVEVIIPAGTPSARQLTTQQSDDSVFTMTSHHTAGDDDVHHSFSPSAAALHVAELAELELPSVHASCHTNVVFSETLGESNTDEIGSVDLNPLDFSTSELIPQTRERGNESKSSTLKSGFGFLDEW